MNLQDLQPSAFLTFIKVAERGSFTAASKELGVSQSAVSQTVEKLEEKLGRPLLERGSRPLVLTGAGREVLRCARRFVEEARLMQNSLNLQVNREVKSLRIGLSEVVNGFFSDKLEQFLIPKLQSLEVQTGLIPQILEDFENGLLDIAIAPDISDRPARIRHLILKESYFVVCNNRFCKELRNFEKDAFRGVELPFISYRSNSADRRKAQSFLRRIGLNSTVSYELENTRSVIRAVENGLGWTILPPLNILLGDDTSLLSVRKIDDPGLKKRLFIATDRPMLKPMVEELEALFFETFDFLCGYDNSEVFRTLKTGMKLPELIS